MGGGKIKIYTVHDGEFAAFGRVISVPFFDKFDRCADKIEMPKTSSAYRASEPSFESEETMCYYRDLFGGLDVQIGYCWGENSLLNALEWHKSSEISVALTDMIMLFGDLRIMKDDKYDTSNVKAFLLKRGESIEIFATTMHFCPIGVDGKKFANVVILPRGTNTPLARTTDDKRLISTNKWIIIHPDFKKQVELGRVIGLIGENIAFE